MPECQKLLNVHDGLHMRMIDEQQQEQGLDRPALRFALIFTANRRGETCAPACTEGLELTSCCCPAGSAELLREGAAGQHLRPGGHAADPGDAEDPVVPRGR